MKELLFDHDFSDAITEKEKNSRWSQIDTTASFIVERLRTGQKADLMFLCTHNSRRSQFAHVWAEVFAYAFSLDGVRCYSGGTEVTACNERTIAALQRFGFEVESTGDINPDYSIRFAESHPPVLCNSSLFEAAELSDFAAMMCCSDVDNKCPTVVGATIRIPLHYDDPKSADDTPQEESRYNERCRQIGGDMLLLMSVVAKRKTLQ